MRTAARRLLTEDAELPSDEELDTLTLQLRGHLMLAIPAVEALADRLPQDDVSRACAHAGVMEARTRLSLEPRQALPARIAHAQRLARSVNALCDHYENLSGEQPLVLDAERAALLRVWDHCLNCPTCTSRDETTGANLNLECAVAGRLLTEYLRVPAVRGASD
ncbi:DUF6415 family natural product biosynthesis protein [Streptomyces sp. MN13]